MKDVVHAVTCSDPPAAARIRTSSSTLAFAHKEQLMSSTDYFKLLTGQQDPSVIHVINVLCFSTHPKVEQCRLIQSSI